MTIIWILSTLVVVTSNNAKEKAENKGVINLSEVISSAVNVYYFKNGKYPTIN